MYKILPPYIESANEVAPPASMSAQRRRITDKPGRVDPKRSDIKWAIQSADFVATD